MTKTKEKPTAPAPKKVACRFSIGAVVELKSGSPAMTVGGFDDSSGAFICTMLYWDAAQGKYAICVAHEDALKICPPSKKRSR